MIHRPWRFLLEPYDLLERHLVVAQLLQRALAPLHADARILDVGGRAGLLERFSRCRVVAANLDATGDLITSATALPFADGEFDAVASMDTLEHLPRAQRPRLIAEAWRVARRCVVIAAPYGSAEHIAHERELDALYREVVGRPHPYLSEHIRFGLPQPDEIETLAASVPAASRELYYAGDFIRQGRTFVHSFRMAHRSRLIARAAGLYARVSGMALWQRLRLHRAQQQATNRFYLLLRKT